MFVLEINKQKQNNPTSFDLMKRSLCLNSIIIASLLIDITPIKVQNLATVTSFYVFLLRFTLNVLPDPFGTFRVGPFIVCNNIPQLLTRLGSQGQNAVLTSQQNFKHPQILKKSLS